MQILTLVCTTLMILAIVTYARLDHFLDQSFVKTQYEKRLQEVQINGFNLAQKTHYSLDHMSEGNTGGRKVPNTVSLVSLQFFIDKQSRGEQDPAFLFHQQLIKNLMLVLYKDQPFFRPVKENPELLDVILQQLIAAIDAKENKLSAKEDLVKVSLESSALDEIWYHMLQGTLKASDIKKQQQTELQKKDREAPVHEDLEENYSVEGYVSLLDLMTIKKGPKIRIFLAKKPILEAIYGDSGVVNTIVEARKSLHSRAKKDESLNSLSQEFQDGFQSQTPNWAKDMLDFHVTKTNPPKD